MRIWALPTLPAVFLLFSYSFCFHRLVSFQFLKCSRILLSKAALSLEIDLWFCPLGTHIPQNIIPQKTHMYPSSLFKAELSLWSVSSSPPPPLYQFSHCIILSFTALSTTIINTYLGICLMAVTSAEWKLHEGRNKFNMLSTMASVPVHSLAHRRHSVSMIWLSTFSMPT